MADLDFELLGCDNQLCQAKDALHLHFLQTR
jgi:hypothetical protein